MRENGGGVAVQTYRQGVALVLVAGLLWSLMVLGIKLVEGQNAWAIVAWRSAGMAPVVMAAIWWQGGAAALRALMRPSLPAAIGAVALAVCFALAIVAIQTTTAANAVFPLAVTPFVSALLARVFLGEPIRRATAIAIGVAALGVFVMVAEGLNSGTLMGNLAALGGACFFAVFTVCLRWGGAGSSLPGTFWGAVCAVALGLGTAAALGLPTTMPVRDMALVLALGAVLLGFGLTLFAIGSRSVPAAELSLLSMLEILLSPIWVWLVLDETSSAMTYLGGAIVLAAILYNAVSGLRRSTVRAA